MSQTDAARILIVDDEASLMKALCDTLRERGYEVIGCTSGKAALAALREDGFDLLLADLMMPEMDGVSLLREASKQDPDLVGIIMTGQATVDTAVEAMKSGALDYILKPFKLATIQPVLDRALAVRRLRRNSAALERRLRQHTVQLESANKELEAFTSSISHDLRAPLRSIASMSELLIADFSDQMPEEAADLLGRISGKALRMQQLIDDLLRFSRLSQQPLAMQHVDAENLVNGVLEELHAESGERSIQIGALEDFYGDPSLMRQVFANLLSNAFKFTRHRESGTVEVGSSLGDDETVYYVRDNGTGFDMKDAEKLFAVFQRLHSASEFEGTGIGLSIVRRIVERHGGRVWAEAELDRGATFYFTLPRE